MAALLSLNGARELNPRTPDGAREQTFNSDHLMPASWILHWSSSFPNIMFRIVTKHCIGEMAICETTRNIHLEIMI